MYVPWTMTPAEAEDFRERYVASLPGAAAKLVAQHGSELGLDGSLASVERVSDWFLGALAVDDPAWDGELPVWWNPESPVDQRGFPPGDPDHPRFTVGQLRLIDAVQAYVLGVVQSFVPQARWITYRDKNPRDSSNGEPQLVAPEFSRPAEGLHAVYYVAQRVLYPQQAVPAADWVAQWTVTRLNEAGVDVSGMTAVPYGFVPSPGLIDSDSSTGYASPSGGQMLVCKGRPDRYLEHGPVALVRVDEAVVAQVWAEQGIVVEGDEGEGTLSLGSLVWECWYERDKSGVLRAVGGDWHFDAVVDPSDVRAVLEGLLDLAKRLRAGVWCMEMDPPEKVTVRVLERWVSMYSSRAGT